MALLKITIRGWLKHNSRKDVKTPSWFKFKHKFFEDADFYHFTHSEMLFWVYLLCETSKKNDNGKITVNTEHAHRVARFDLDVQKSAILKLQQLRMIEVKTLRARYVDVTDACARQDKIRLEEIRLENTIAHFDVCPDKAVQQQKTQIPAPESRCNFNFEEAYKKYPKKLGKTAGIKKCKTHIKTEQDYQDLLKAIDRFTLFHSEKKTGAEFLPYFSTFMSGWRDWLDADTGAARVSAQGNILSEKELLARQEEEEYSRQRKKLLESYGISKPTN